VQAFDGPIYIADAALYLKAKQPALGIKDPYELNEAQYKAALELLRAQRKLVGKYWHDAFVQIDDFTNEGVVASSSWQFQANILGSKKRPIATVVPAEGATGWADSTMMHADAKHPNCAYMWLEHSLNPKLQGDLAAWFGSVPSVPAACKGNKLLTDDGCKRQGYESFEKISFWRTPVAQCASQGNQCVPYHKWVSDYIAILGGR
jgi:putative spermidine/putrescine transport system substrate-binding protein